MQHGTRAGPQSRAPEHALLPQGCQSATAQNGLHKDSLYVGFLFSQGAGDATRRGAADHALRMQGHPSMFQAAPESGFQHAGEFPDQSEQGSQHGHGDKIHFMDVPAPNRTGLLHQDRDGPVTVQEAAGRIAAPQPLEVLPLQA